MGAAERMKKAPAGTPTEGEREDRRSPGGLREIDNCRAVCLPPNRLVSSTTDRWTGAAHFSVMQATCVTATLLVDAPSQPCPQRRRRARRRLRQARLDPRRGPRRARVARRAGRSVLGLSRPGPPLREGELERFDVGDGRARFERTGHHHEHIVCSDCGQVAEVPGCLIDQARARGRAPHRLRGHRAPAHLLGHAAPAAARRPDAGAWPRRRRRAAPPAGRPLGAAAPRPASHRDGVRRRRDDRRGAVRDHAGGIRARSREAAAGSRWRSPPASRVFAVLERRIFHHVHVEDAICNPRAAEIGAGGITTHAFLDGLAIGSAFQISSELGLLVSAAVLLHAFADGLNTVTILLRHGHRHRTAVAWLAADAAAPILGAAVGLLTPLPDAVFAGLLAFFAGMFLYFGAGSLLPQAHRSGRNRVLVVSAAAAGIGLAFAPPLLAG